jgi:hypothetical protein
MIFLKGGREEIEVVILLPCPTSNAFVKENSCLSTEDVAKAHHG